MFAMVLACTMAACSSSDDDNDETSGSGSSDITISSTYTDGVTVSSTGATLTINVQSSNTVSATSSESWCTVSVGTMTATLKVTPVTIVVAENASTNDRSCVITFTAGSASVSITVTQTATDGLIVETTSYTVSADGGTLTVVVTANGDYEVETGASWITSVTSRADMADYEEQFTIDANPSSSERTSTITFTLNELVETVTVTQEGGEAADMSYTAKEIAAQIYAGINIGNTMECTSYEGAWSGAKVNETYLAALKEAGFNAVRIPCAWDTYIDDDDDTYTIDADWLERVYEVVGWCIALDMYVVLNAHWDNGWLEDNIFDSSLEEDIIAEQTAIWTQVAEKMEGYDYHLLFAACNEPGMNETSGSSTMWSGTSGKSAIARLIEYEQTMIDAVRATGGNNEQRCLVIQGLGTDISNTYTYMDDLPTDEAEDRLLMEVHYYEPYQFCLMTEDASWGNVFYYWGSDNYDTSDTSHNPTWGELDNWLIPQMAKMTEKYVSEGIPCIIGEYGCEFRTTSTYSDMDQDKHDASVAYYNECVTREAKNAGCVPFYWETGSVFNRTTGSIKREDVVSGIMQGAADGEYPF